LETCNARGKVAGGALTLVEAGADMGLASASTEADTSGSSTGSPYTRDADKDETSAAMMTAHTALLKILEPVRPLPAHNIDMICLLRLEAFQLYVNQIGLEKPLDESCSSRMECTF
jgi:hypothetical protein